MRPLLLSLIFLAAPCWGQLTVTPEATWGEPIIAQLESVIPEGATFEGQGWILPPGVGAHHFDARTIGLWPERAGTYQIKYQGFWIHVQPVTVLGADGNPITINTYLGHGYLDFTASFTLKGAGPGPQPEPDPKPEPDPTPVQQLGAIIIEDAAQRTSLPYGQVQAMTLPDIRALATEFRLVDKQVVGPDDQPPPHLQPFLQLASSTPYLVLYDVASKRVLWQGAVPASAAAMRALLQSHRVSDTPAPPVPEQEELSPLAATKEKAPASAPVLSSPKVVRRVVCTRLGRCYVTYEVAP